MTQPTGTHIPPDFYLAGLEYVGRHDPRRMLGIGVREVMAAMFAENCERITSNLRPKWQFVRDDFRVLVVLPMIYE